MTIPKPTIRSSMTPIQVESRQIASALVDWFVSQGIPCDMAACAMATLMGTIAGAMSTEEAGIAVCQDMTRALAASAANAFHYNHPEG
jgi:hypothetical protein